MADVVKWGTGREQVFRDFFYVEMHRALNERKALEASWQRYLIQYRAPQPPPGHVNNFPYPGASAAVYPLTQQNVDPSLARYMSSVHAPSNLWTLLALNERWIKAAKPLQDYLEWLDHRLLKMFDVNYRVFLECLKLGTGVYKTSWRYEQRRTMTYDSQKRRVRALRTINQPSVDHVALINFLTPPEAIAVDPDAQGGASWCAERHQFRPLQLQTMAQGQAPFLPNFDPTAVEKILTYVQHGPTPMQQTVRQLDSLGATPPTLPDKPIDVWEVHARFDTTGDQREDDVVVLFHLPTSTILRAIYNPWPARPYSVVRRKRGDGFYGIGLCEESEVFQTNISHIVNFNIDKLLLTNAPMIGYKSGANILPNEPIYPGKQWPLDDPDKDLKSFFLTAPGSYDIMSLVNFFEMGSRYSTGVSELQQGAIGSLPSRTPATTVQSLLAEGANRIDLSLKDLRTSGLSEVGLRVLQMLQQQANDPVNNPEGRLYLDLAGIILGEPEGSEVQRVLSIPQEAIELGIGCELTATSGSSNKELIRQSNLALLQLYGTVGPQFLQLAQLVQQGGPVGETAAGLFKGGAELLGRVLEQFDVRNPEDIVPNLNALAGALSQSGQPISPLAGAGGAAGAGGPAFAGGM